MIIVFYFLAAVLIFLSFRSFRGGIAYLEYFRDESAKQTGSYILSATVIAPCKGLDEGLHDNLRAVVEQDYPEYEVVFVVDSADDPAVGVIQKVTQEMIRPSPTTKLVIASKTTNSGQKVENLREAVLHASERSKVFVFVDSDVTVSKDWLRGLIAPLEDKQIGASTGYRWFISEKQTFASEMRSVWNASIASALGSNVKSNFCWGGSTAIRRDVFEQIDMREKWQGTLSDDFAVTRAMKEQGLAIYFVPRALTASVGNCSFHELLEFTNRQMKITRVYAPHLWLTSFIGSFVFLAVMISAFLIVIFSKGNGFIVWLAIAVLLLVSFFSIGKSWLRLKAVGLILSTRWPQIGKQWLTQNTLWILSPALFLLNCLAALISRRVTWRGIRYELKSPRETVIITD